MIPYIGLTHIQIGPVMLYIWGLFAALGFFAGLMLLMRFGKKRGLNQDHLLNLFFWIMAAAMIGGRLFEVFAYNPAYYFSRPAEIIKFWAGGMSSFGGILGALAAFIIYVRVKKLSWAEYADALIFPLPLGLGIGRIGCFLINEHPGRFTNFFLGVRYPDGVRHDLGLEFALLDFFVFAILVIAARKYRPVMITKLFIFTYFPLRFFLEFLRAIDITVEGARYFSFTPAQWGSAAVIVLSALILARRKPHAVVDK